jgi:hypothetical protein
MPNNWCGHGFYQFSPELFYRVFSEVNGFCIVEMYVTTVEGRAFAVANPEHVRGRVELCNDEPLFLLVHARRDAVREIFAQPPQQSDYVAHWAGGSGACAAAVPPRWKAYPVIRQLRELRAGWKKRGQIRQMERSRSLNNRKLYTPVDLSI